jgi:ubiquinone/menaquinone biosynthesis C-methylase UbiE
MNIWERYEILFWILIGVSIYLFILIIIYLVLKFAFHKKISSIGMYLSYLTLSLPFWPLGEITAYPRRRKMWLVKSGLKEGQSYLEEGFGIGTSPILASKIVGSSGVVYALDNQPFHITLLSLRKKIRRIKNIRLILSDAKETGLEDNSIDTIFICDAFHEFPDKKNTALELYRILKPGGILSVLEEESVKYANNAQNIIETTKLFNLVERDKKFIKFKKER